MALNRYMHPRNIYKNPPNFKQLAVDFPEFRQYVKQDVLGKVTIDFKDSSALRALTCSLLKKDFDLTVVIPPNKMIPTIPLRLNYVLWIEDLLTAFGMSENIIGIDVGTGASCVYALLGAKQNGWSMIATDTDKENVVHARQNVSRNALDHKITVREVNGSTLLTDALGYDDPTKEYDFCMCNPPFFTCSEELNSSFKARRPDRPRPKNAFCASLGEVVVDGGEIAFVTKLIDESKHLLKKIRVYSSMIGQKSSLPPLKKLIREANVVSFKQTEFCQGRTTRWGLAWTFCDMDIRTPSADIVAAARKLKMKPPLSYCLQADELDLDDVDDKIKIILEKLKVEYHEIKHSKALRVYNLTAYSNTWSHQRRKKREQTRINCILNNNCNNKLGPTTSIPQCTVNNNTSDILSTVEMVANMNVASPSKREFNDEETVCPVKRFKAVNGDSCCLKFTLMIRKNGCEYAIQLSPSVEELCNRDGIHQILQYIKNNMKL